MVKLKQIGWPTVNGKLNEEMLIKQEENQMKLASGNTTHPN